MGLFKSLFGSAGSDKADKMRQAAIDAFTSIKSPALEDLQIQLSEYVAAGRLTPAQAETELLKSNAFNEIVTDPALEGAQKQALMSLQEIGTQGGLTAVDRARMADITSEQNQIARGRNEAIMTDARARGMGGSDISTVNRLLSEQSAADRASRQGTDVAAQAEARALQALIQGGNLAGNIRGQDYGEQATRAGAENAIDLFNKQTLNQTNLYNIDAANRAQAGNLANEQRIADANVGTMNAQEQYNALQHQQAFQNEMAKAQGVAGTYSQWASEAAAADRAETAADMAMMGRGASVLAPSLGDYGGSGGMGDGGSAPEESGGGGGKVENVVTSKMGIRNAFAGGEVPGEAPIPGNHPANDTVPARLSPGEVVVPRTAMSDDEEFDAFMTKFRPTKRNQPVQDPDKPLIAQALTNIQSRLDRIEGR